MDAYAMHLAMAALVGASFVAVSAYFMHRKTLNQLLEFAKTMEREREDFEDDSPRHLKKYAAADVRRNNASRKGNNGYYRRASISMPDVTTIAGAGDANGPLYVDGIPPGLPRLHTLPEGIIPSIFNFIAFYHLYLLNLIMSDSGLLLCFL